MLIQNTSELELVKDAEQIQSSPILQSDSFFAAPLPIEALEAFTTVLTSDS